MTLTPRPRSCWPRILHVWLLSAPNSVLFAGKLPGTAPSWRQGGGHPSWRAEGPRESLGSLLPGAGLFSPLADYSVMLYMAVDHGRLYSTFRASTMPFVPLLSCPHSALGSTPTWLHGSSQGDQRRGQPPAPAGLPRDTTMQAGSTCPACCLRPPGPTTATRRMAPEAGEMKRCRQAPPVGGQGGSDERLRLCSPSSPPHTAGGALTGHCPLLPSSMVLPASPLSALNCWSLQPAP